MSVADALRDGIEMIEVRGRGHQSCAGYRVPCSNCGKLHVRKAYTGKQVYLCPACKEIKKFKDKEIKRKQFEMPDVETKGEARLRLAIEELEKQGENISEYSEAIAICKQCCNKFGSVPEAMIGIILIQNNFRIIPQQKIGKYHVDFAIPKYKLIVEVDGKPYHSDKRKELEREARIGYMLGFDWKFLHIPAEYVSKDAKKVLILVKRALRGL